MCVLVHEHVCVHECGGPRLTSGSFLDCSPLYLGERQRVHGTRSSQTWLVQLASPSPYCLCQFMPSFRRCCSITCPLLCFVSYTSENSTTVSAVFQDRDPRIIVFFLSFPLQNLTNQQAYLFYCQNVPILPGVSLLLPPHPVISHSSSALCPLLASCNRSPYRRQKALLKAQAMAVLWLNTLALKRTNVSSI